MVSFPPCKINLGLQILSKRQDGYHEISTCFYPLPWTDMLEILPSKTQAFVQTGISIPGDPGDNLCLKAYDLLKKDFNLPPVKIHLHKIIPTGAGLGGGSSDAAHMLSLLDSLFSLNQSKESLMKYASQIGSDCPFFIHDMPMLGSGRGDVLEPIRLSLKGLYLYLVKPELHISTAEAYANVVPSKSSVSIAEVLAGQISGWREKLTNDFEDSVFQKHPVIRELKNELYAHGARYASMSGSGSTVFGIFKDDKIAGQVSRKEIWQGWL